MIGRAEAIDRLRKQRFDVLVIGGGITGAGVALDAASRGLTVALIEKSDFASGTSSRSSKVIHGGLRYLTQLQFGVTRESARERELLLRMAPHLVQPLRIILPYRNGFGIGPALSIYDAMASVPKTRKHRKIETSQMRGIAPHLRSDVRGAFQYFDATADDCRLVMHVLKKAAELGAIAANYVEAIAFGGDYTAATDSAGGESFTIRSDAVVNATGVWSDRVRSKVDSSATPRMRSSKGVHLVIDSDKLRIDGAVTIPKTSKGHYLFVSPWEGRTIIGTTDTEYDGVLENPVAAPSDIATLLEAVEEWFPSARITEKDILATYAGLRPLPASKAATYATPREDFIERNGRLITVAGGKLTTFRRMAKRAVDMITHAPCVTDQMSLFASNAPPSDVPDDIAAHLHRAFGSEAQEIATQEGAGARLIEEHPHTWAEIDHVIRTEMPMTVADVLARRTRVALIARDHGRSVAAAVATRLGGNVDNAVTRFEEEVKEYSR